MTRYSLFALALVAVGCAPAQSCPTCDPGTHCDDTSGACVPDQSPPDAATADLAIEACAPACEGATPRCNASHHCVACLADGDCPNGTRCKIVSDAIASCVPGCTDDTRCEAGQRCCGGACVDPMTDTAHCGACDAACASSHGSASCKGGQCAIGPCSAGWADCNHDPKDGCEANLSADPSNCSTCGAICQVAHAVTGCASGCYMRACEWGYDDCDNNAANGCETQVGADPKSCGKCGNVCKTPANGTAGCVAGNCVIGSCNLGFVDCDGNAANGCEASVAFDAANCGGCGQACGNGQGCNNGVCTTVYKSCQEILDAGMSLGDGGYTIDPDGNGMMPAFPVFCDMTTDGGGWTVCYNHNITNVEEMDQSTPAHMSTHYGAPGAQSEFGADCRGTGHALQAKTIRFTAADGAHWVQINNAPDAAHEFFFAGGKATAQVNITTWKGNGMSWTRQLCNHDCPGFGYGTGNINQIALGTNSGNCFEHNSKSSDSNHHWAIFGNCDGTYVEGPNQGAGGAQPDLPRSGYARVMLR